MANKNINVDVPFDFCEACDLCTVNEIEYNTTAIGDEERHIEKVYYCEHQEICVNAVRSYVQSKKNKDK